MIFEKSLVEKNTYELNLELHQVNETPINNIKELFTQQKILENQENIFIPCNIFRQGLSGLEAIIKYLKEEHNLKYSQISKLINRDQRTIWTTYNKIKKHKIINETDTKKYANFNVSLLKNRNLSVLEILATTLKNQGFSIKEISEILGKNNKTIWTVLNRAKNKNIKEVAQ